MNFNIRDTLYFLIIFNYLKNDEEKSLYISESYFVLKICENGTYKNFLILIYIIIKWCDNDYNNLTLL